MTFEEKVKFIRSLPLFKVIPISEVRAIAFAAAETDEPALNHYIIGMSGAISLVLTKEDIEKIVRVYPDLEAKFSS